MDPKNLIIFMSDEHTRSVTGCYGHDFIHTPNIDALAAGGTRFDAAYTNCPVCVPARASFATGRYVHDIGAWDNAQAFDGTDTNWHAVLRDRGHQTVSIGKLHFRSGEDDNGFADEQIAMHIIDGKGDLLGLIRDDDTPVRGASWKMAKLAGAGESMYTRYDRDIAAAAQSWIYEEAPKYQDKPWVLFVSLVAPHFPLTAPSEHFYRYYNRDLAPPKLYDKRNEPIHPYIDDYRAIFTYDSHFKDMDMVKRAQAGYLGLITFMDQQVGLVMAALADAGLTDDTRILYTSDHGDNMGARGAWGKSVMYEEAAAVPLILSGPDIPEGKVIETPASFVDIYPFIMDCVGAADEETVPADLPGTNLMTLIDGAEPDRVAFSEYHGMGSKTAAFLIRKGDFKFVYYADYPAQLFNLADDPEELNDLASDPALSNVMASLMDKLMSICDPVAVDKAAREAQAQMIVENGGKPAIIKRGDLGFSVPPGVQPMFD
ncbi:MAG: sulfatase-like hydrolase/transferase [Proteobacteria bacterium]|nr:sulfatase-like hydrolase/transferase [Pseudomonadota bacterium]MDA1024009.1 sulfatase-like hydrolase/transferase [Pseudomonadota bacterium]